MWPLPPIHKSSAGHGWRAGLSGARRSGGRGLRKARRRQENKRARRREPPVLRPRLGSGARLGAARRGPRWGGGGLRRGVLLCAEPGAGGATPLAGAGLWASAKESPGRWLGGQGHLQASQAAPSESLSVAPRRRAPAIWRRWEPRHPSVWPSPGGAPALARGRGRAKGGQREGHLGACGLLPRGAPSPSGDASERHSPVAPFPPGPTSPGRALSGAGWAWRGTGPTRLAADPARCRAPAADLSLPPRSGAQPRLVTPSPPAPSRARRPCAPPP